MIKVNKAIMYVYRVNERKEFFILHRKRNDVVTLTGHIEKGESNIEAARRETIEELGVEPIKITDLNIKTDVLLEKNGEKILSIEHAFLIEIPNKDVHFLEANEKHRWHTLDELYDVLTYPNQREPLNKIKEII